MDYELKLPIILLAVLVFAVFGLVLTGCILYMGPDHIIMRFIRFLFFEGAPLLYPRPWVQTNSATRRRRDYPEELPGK